MKPLTEMTFLVAGYGFPAEHSIQMLFGRGVCPRNIIVITEECDQRNAGLINLATLRSIKTIVAPPKCNTLIHEIENFGIDLLISMHCRHRIPNAVINRCKYGGINLHPSLLPKYRGTNSSAWAIINGEKQTGYTYHYLDHDFDTGNIISQQTTPIFDSDTALSLFCRLMVLGAQGLSDVIDKVLSGEKGDIQCGTGSYYSRRLPHDGMINPEWDDSKVERFIRAMYFPPFPPAEFLIGSDRHQIFSIEDYKNLRSRLETK